MWENNAYILASLICKGYALFYFFYNKAFVETLRPMELSVNSACLESQQMAT